MARLFWMIMLVGLAANSNAQSKELKEKICKECFGSGKCIKCEGRGFVPHHCMSKYCNKVVDKCSACEGIEICIQCKGTGMNIPEGSTICYCNGFGIELRCIECEEDPLDSPHFYMHHFCSICDGKGYLDYLKKGKKKHKKCPMCHGNVAYIKPKPLCHHLQFRQIPHTRCQGKGYFDAKE